MVRVYTCAEVPIVFGWQQFVIHVEEMKQLCEDKHPISKNEKLFKHLTRCLMLSGRRKQGIPLFIYWSLKKRGIISWMQTRQGGSEWITNVVVSKNNTQLPPCCRLLRIIIQPKPDQEN